MQVISTEKEKVVEYYGVFICYEYMARLQNAVRMIYHYETIGREGNYRKRIIRFRSMTVEVTELLE